MEDESGGGGWIRRVLKRTLPRDEYRKACPETDDDDGDDDVASKVTPSDSGSVVENINDSDDGTGWGWFVDPGGLDNEASSSSSSSSHPPSTTQRRPRPPLQQQQRSVRQRTENPVPDINWVSVS